MIETITPAVCGSRTRYRIALVLFAAAAVAAAALLGLVLGVAGSALGAGWAVLAAALLAGAAALREIGIVRFPLPQSRRQVPERWHAELPLAVWASGYGAGLGVGVFTFQPVATFWVACAAALALGRPLAGAACLSLYGVGRTLMVVLPPRGAREPGAAVERLAARRGALVRANAVVLAAAAVALAFAASASAVPLYLGTGSQLDPSFSAGILAYTQREAGVTSVVVRPADASDVWFDGRSPALDDPFLAYDDGAGVRVVRWRQRSEVAHVPGASKPALDWPWLAYRLPRFDGGKELWLRNLATGESRPVTGVGAAADLGRPALAGGRLAWHAASARGSTVALYDVATGRRSRVVRSRIALHAYPSLTASRIAWVEQRQGRTFLHLRLLARGTTVTLLRTTSRDELLWTTALAYRDAYVTRWYVPLDLAGLERIRF